MAQKISNLGAELNIDVALETDTVVTLNRVDENGDPIDITGNSITAKLYDAGWNLISSLTVNLIAPSQGTFSFRINSGDVADMVPQNEYNYQVREEISGALTPLVYGKIERKR